MAHRKDDRNCRLPLEFDPRKMVRPSAKNKNNATQAGPKTGPKNGPDFGTPFVEQ
jgi:hypothetical protein